MAWNDPEIDIEWSELKGKYRGLHVGRCYLAESER